ncbi:MAG: hypothetical protein ACI4AA_05055 [Lachnospiraceae bacterium]
MKLKYYMRGLGIGIVVTALLMGVALSGRKEKMTDDEIRARAAELGMVEEESGVLADDLGKEEPEEAEETGQAENVVSGNKSPETKIGTEAGTEPEETDKEDAEPEDTTGTESDRAEEAVSVETAEKADQTESYIIKVNSGDGSRSVANRLQEAGIIEDAAAFDVFLCQNGYDKRIAAGEHEIPVGATNEEIAEALTR